MKALLDRVHEVDPGWKANGFLVDDAAAEIDPIRQMLGLTFFVLCFYAEFILFKQYSNQNYLAFRETFSCPVLFSLWRVRRSWLRNVVKKCKNVEVQREMFKRLGEIVYSIWNGSAGFELALEKFTEDFVDEDAFLHYFRATWLPKIG